MGFLAVRAQDFPRNKSFHWLDSWKNFVYMYKKVHVYLYVYKHEYKNGAVRAWFQ